MFPGDILIIPGLNTEKVRRFLLSNSFLGKSKTEFSKYIHIYHEMSLYQLRSASFEVLDE